MVVDVTGVGTEAVGVWEGRDRDLKDRPDITVFEQGRHQPGFRNCNTRELAKSCAVGVDKAWVICCRKLGYSVSLPDRAEIEIDIQIGGTVVNIQCNVIDIEGRRNAAAVKDDAVGRRRLQVQIPNGK